MRLRRKLFHKLIRIYLLLTVLVFEINGFCAEAVYSLLRASITADSNDLGTRRSLETILPKLTNPQRSLVYCRMAEMCIVAGDRQKQVAYYEKGTINDSNSLTAASGYAISSSAGSGLTKAWDAIGTWSALDSSNALPLYLFARNLAVTNNAREALELITRAHSKPIVRHYPVSAQIFTNLNDRSLLTNDVSAFLQIVQLTSMFQGIHLHLRDFAQTNALKRDAVAIALTRMHLQAARMVPYSGTIAISNLSLAKRSIRQCERIPSAVLEILAKYISEAFSLVMEMEKPGTYPTDSQLSMFQEKIRIIEMQLVEKYP